MPLEGGDSSRDQDTLFGGTRTAWSPIEPTIQALFLSAAKALPLEKDLRSVPGSGPKNPPSLPPQVTSRSYPVTEVVGNYYCVGDRDLPHLWNCHRQSSPVRPSSLATTRTGPAGPGEADVDRLRGRRLWYATQAGCRPGHVGEEPQSFKYTRD